jgi:hypothetical protein
MKIIPIILITTIAALLIVGCEKNKSESYNSGSVESHRREVDSAIDKAQKEGKSDADVYRAGEAALEKSMRK